MADEASFLLRLIDKVSGPARKMQGQLSGVQAKFGGLKSSLGGTNAALTATNRGLRTVGGAAASTGGIIQTALGFSLGGAINSVASSVLSLGASMVKATIGAVMFGQESELAFSQLAKHGASAGKLFDHARGLAEKYGMSVKDTTDQFRDLLAVQFNPKTATDIIKLGADMRVLGGDAEKTKGIINALGQIKSKGRLQAEELLQLNERSISADLVKGQIAKTLGIARSEVEKQMDAGKIDAATAIEAVLNTVKIKLGEKNLGDAGEKFADNTLRGMFGKLAAKAENRLTDIGKQLEPAVTAAFKPVRDRLSALLDNPKLQGGIADVLTRIADGARAALPWIELIGSIGLQTLRSFGKGFTGTVDVGARFDELGGKFEAFLTKMGSPEIQAIAQRFGERIGIVVDFAFKLTGALLDIIPAALQVADAVQRPINAVLGVITPLVGKMIGIGAALVGGLVEGIMSGVGMALDAVGKLGTSVITKLRNVLGIKSPSKEFAKLGDMSGLGFVEGLQGSLAANDTKLGDFMPSDVAVSQGPVLSSFGSAGAATLAGAGGGSVSIQNRFEFNITQQPGESGEDLARDIESRVRREVGSMFEQMAIEAA